jgi:acyl transferase domain-containing protein
LDLRERISSARLANASLSMPPQTVLKRMEDAIAHGDHIHGIIRGTSVNQSGTSKSITHPDADTQALLLGGLLERSKTPAQTISVVEAHGTGVCPQ